MVDDETLFKTMQTAAETGALVMVHAENGDAIDIIVKEAVAAGKTEPSWHARTRPPETEGEATNRAIQLARVAGAPLYVVHVSCAGVDRADRDRPREGLGHLGRDVHPVPVHRRVGARPARLRGRRSTSTRRRRGRRKPGAPLARAADATSCRSSPPTTARSTGPSRRASTAQEFQKVPNGGPGIENRLHMLHEFGVRTGPADAEPLRRADLDQRRPLVRPLPAQGHDRAGLGRRHRRLGSREEADASRRRRTTRTSTTTCSRAPRSTGAPEVVLVRGQVIVENDELVAPAGRGQFVKRAKVGEELLAAPKAGLAAP